MSYPIKKLDDGQWWITKTTPITAPHDRMGPYDTRREAEEDRRGLERFEQEAETVATD